MKDTWHLDEYHRAIEALILESAEKHGEGLIIDELVKDTFANAIPQIVDSLSKELAKNSKSMLAEHRSLRSGFVKRNFKRWRAGFDLLEQLIVISQEAGSAINDALRPNAVIENDPLFEAVVSNHARAVQVSREIMALMTSGFPDGALGRWRTLHEIAVVSMFLAEAGKEAAERYILHDHVMSYRRARQYMEHHQRANLQPLDVGELDRLKVAHDEIVNRYGQSMKQDYGWAASHLQKARPTFADLEVATKLDHWRPRYKWATTNTHGAYRTQNSGLATSESENPVLSVGESNSGMTDPAHMTAISLNLATMPVIMLAPNVDRLAISMIMQRLSDEIGDTFLNLDRPSWEREQKRRHRKRDTN
jgi:Family of unknown function (DUF5677)